MLNIDFRNYLVREREYEEELKNMPETLAELAVGFGMYKPVRFNGGYQMSIQASRGHYSIPRDMRDKNEYTAFEVALMNQGGEFLNFKDEFGIDFLEESNEDVVYGYVSVESVQKAFSYMANRFGIQPSQDYFKFQD